MLQRDVHEAQGTAIKSLPPPPPDYTGLGRDTPLGQLLVNAGVVNDFQLREALQVQRRTGVRLGEALVSLGHADPNHVAQALAYKHRLETFDLGAFAAGEGGRAQWADPWCRDRRIVMFPTRDGGVAAATTDPMNRRLLEELRQRTGRPVRPVVATNQDIEAALHLVHRDANREQSVARLRKQAADQSAHRVLTTRQKVALSIVITCCVLMLLRDWRLTLVMTTAAVTLLHVLASAYKLYLLQQGSAAGGQRTVPLAREDTATRDDHALPVYTVLVPLYREAAVLPQLMRAIAALDWPKPKLDVRLLLEEDDLDTIRAAHAADLPAYVTIVLVPRAGPRGKPKACNYGLAHARGAYVVIFDAEDIPDPHQLRQAYAALCAGGPQLACVQARLNFYNPNQNMLTRWFTAEYALWFDLFLPGLQRAGAPIPLGGTSNHFRRDILDQVGAWDPFNVTEDADLGIRLHKLGLRTVVLDSTTYEEATSTCGNWIRQRSRWIKGYAQTWLVHMRHPLALWRALGVRGFWGFQLMVGGTCLVLLLNPFYWALTLLWFASYWGWIQWLFPGPVFFLGGIALYLGNFAFTYLTMAGALARGHDRLVKYTLLSPLYWALMSIAAWKGVFQLVYAASYWEKTNHGLAAGALYPGSAEEAA